MYKATSAHGLIMHITQELSIVVHGMHTSTTRPIQALTVSSSDINVYANSQRSSIHNDTNTKKQLEPFFVILLDTSIV